MLEVRQRCRWFDTLQARWRAQTRRERLWVSPLATSPTVGRPAGVPCNVGTLLASKETLIKSHVVVPAKAGTQASQALLDPRLRGDDTYSDVP
jgi:hypothetical protein